MAWLHGLDKRFACTMLVMAAMTALALCMELSDTAVAIILGAQTAAAIWYLLTTLRGF